MSENDDLSVDLKLWRPGDPVPQSNPMLDRINGRIKERMSPGASNGVVGGLAKPPQQVAPPRSERRSGQRKPRMRRRGVALSTDQTPWVTPNHPPQVYDITKSGRVRGRA